MIQHGQKAPLTDRPETVSGNPEVPERAQVDEATIASAEPSWMDMLDPAARQARIDAARQRREEALARRKAGLGTEPSHRPAGVVVPRTTPVTSVSPRSAPVTPLPSRMPRNLSAEADEARRSADERAAETEFAFRNAMRAGGAMAPAPTVETVRRVETRRPRAPAREEQVAPTWLVADARTRLPTPKAKRQWSARARVTAIFLAGLCAGGIGALLALGPLAGRMSGGSTETGVPSVVDIGPLVPGGEVVENSAPRLPDRITEDVTQPEELAPLVAEPAPVAVAEAEAMPPLPFLLPTALSAMTPVPGVTLPAIGAAAMSAVEPAAPAAPGPDAVMPPTALRLATAPVVAPVEPPKVARVAVDADRVYVHFPPSAAAEATAAVEALRAAGVGEASAVQVGFSVGRANVRFFHGEDREAAVTIASLIDGAIDQAPESRDFTDFRPSPAAGLIEVWLAGTAPDGVAQRPAVGLPGLATAVQRPATVAQRPAATGRPRVTTVASPRTVVANDKEAEEVHRIILERSVERMLREKIRAN